MNKIMDFVRQMTLDNSFRYPGLVKRDISAETRLDPTLWGTNPLFHDAAYELRSINLQDL
jgi:hypothetical protein